MKQLNPGDKVLIRECPCEQCSPNGMSTIRVCLSDTIGSVGVIVFGHAGYDFGGLIMLDVGVHGLWWFRTANVVKIDGD